MSQLPPPIPAPTASIIDVSILRQFTGQDAVQDPIIAQRQYESAKAVLAVAEKQLKKANRLAQYRRIRLSAARKGIAGWIAALIIGSAIAITLALLLIFA